MIKTFEEFSGDMPTWDSPNGPKIRPQMAPSDKHSHDPKGKPRFILTILTKERLDKFRGEKSGDDLINWAGYHFSPESLEDCEKRKSEYKIGGTFNGETIVDLIITSEARGMGISRSR